MIDVLSASPPPWPTAVDPLESLAQGLIFFTPLVAGGGPVFDWITGLQLPLNASATWGSGPQGGGLLCTANGAGAKTTLPPELRIVSPFSYATGIYAYAVPSANVSLIATSVTADGASTPGYSLGAGNTIIQILNNNGTTNVAITSTTYAAGNHVISASATTAAASLYLDGLLVNSGSWAAADPSYTGSSIIEVGAGGSFYSARNPHMLIYWTAAWNRLLSAAEHAAIASNIWWLTADPLSADWLASASAPPTIAGRRTIYCRAGSRGVM